MNTNDLIDALGSLDDGLIQETEALRQRKKRPVWLKWGALAACLCIAVAGAWAVSRPTDVPADAMADLSASFNPAVAVAYGFTLDAGEPIIYFPIDAEQRARYGLTDHRAAEADLGEPMGAVADCGDEGMIGCSVYHYAAYPDYDSICILETPAGYIFYAADWIQTGDAIGQSSDVFLDAYGLPGSLEKLEILTNDFTLLYTVEDQATADAIFALLAGRENSGLEANERRFAQAWYDAYGNDDVYFSEEDGHCRFRTQPTQGETITYTDAEGNVIVQGPPTDTSIYDAAHALWYTGERLLQITTDRGFQFYIDYFPSISTFICGDGYYELPPEDVETLNALLQIEE